MTLDLLFTQDQGSSIVDAVCLNQLWSASLDIEIDAQAAFNRDYAAGKI